MSTSPKGSSSGQQAMGAVAATAATVAGGAWVPVVLTDPPGWNGAKDPLSPLLGILTGQITWTLECSLIAAAEAAIVIGVGAAVVGLRRKGGRARRADRRARHLARGAELKGHTRKDVRDSAKRLRVGQSRRGPHDDGAFVGTTVLGGAEVWQSWEDCSLDVWGTRAGKTTSRTIPLVVAAPGPVIATSRKADLYDATRGPRETDGRTVWLFDPLDMVGRPQSMWINLLAGINSITDARRLASAFCYTGADVKRDEFFGPKGDDLVACLILAAAVGGRNLGDVYDWATMPENEEAVELLETHGHTRPARTVAGNMALAEKTRSGVYGAAEKSLQCLTDERILRWVTPPSAWEGGASVFGTVTEFKPEQFVASRDTLHLVCEKGAGAPTPLIAGVTDTIYRYGEALARRSPGRRLPNPLLSVLDEAANICVLENLVSYTSYFGSLGMPLCVFLQSASQGEEAWGKLGMKALWSHANVRTLGGGLADFDFLEEQSRLVGDFDESVKTTSASSSEPLGSRSTSTSTRPTRIYDVSDLSALPKGRAVVFTSGNRPTMVKTRPWWECDFAAAVRDSLEQYGPGAAEVDADD